LNALYKFGKLALKPTQIVVLAVHYVRVGKQVRIANLTSLVSMPMQRYLGQLELLQTKPMLGAFPTFKIVGSVDPKDIGEVVDIHKAWSSNVMHNSGGFAPAHAHLQIAFRVCRIASSPWTGRSVSSTTTISWVLISA
jgi:hypothetical protein